MSEIRFDALTIVTAAEGEPHGIRANAVVPGVIFLSSELCTVSGKVLEAGGGEFDVARWSSSDEVDFGRQPVEPETIAERWAEIEGAVTA